MGNRVIDSLLLSSVMKQEAFDRRRADTSNNNPKNNPAPVLLPGTRRDLVFAPRPNKNLSKIARQIPR